MYSKLGEMYSKLGMGTHIVREFMSRNEGGAMR